MGTGMDNRCWFIPVANYILLPLILGEIERSPRLRETAARSTQTGHVSQFQPLILSSFYAIGGCWPGDSRQRLGRKGTDRTRLGAHRACTHRRRWPRRNLQQGRRRQTQPRRLTVARPQSFAGNGFEGSCDGSAVVGVGSWSIGAYRLTGRLGAGGFGTVLLVLMRMVVLLR